MNEKFLVSKELFQQYKLGTMEGCSYDPRELEPELEKERIEALCDAVLGNMLRIKGKFKTLIGRDRCADCTSIIQENMAKLSESNTDIRNRTLETIFNKYMKTEKTEDENIFTEYMKRQVCADLPEAGRLIDLVYHRCRNVSNKDRLDTVNKVIYNTFLEYLKSKNLIMPNNTKGRIHSEKASNYNVTAISENGPDLCVKNTLKYNNTVMSCVSEPGAPACFEYISGSSQFSSLNNIGLINNMFPYECTLSEADPGAHIHVKVCDMSDYQNVLFEIEEKRYMTVHDYISRNPMSFPEEPLVAYVITNVNDSDSDSDFEVNVKVKFVSTMAHISDSNVSVSAELLSQTGDSIVRNDLDRASIWISDDLNELMHSIFRKDHALEDLLCLFLQFLSLNPFSFSSDDYDNEGVLLMGRMVKSEVKDRMVKVAMAAILAPVKNTSSGFTVAPDIDTIATIAGEDIDTVANCIRDFAYAFGLEFFEGKAAQCINTSDYYYNNITSGLSGNSLFQSTNGILESRYQGSWMGVIRPRLKKLLAIKAAKDDHAISVTEFIHTIALSWDEFLAMSNYTHDHTVIPAMSFYMSIFSTIAYIIGHKVASLLPYSIDNYCHRTGVDKRTKTKAIVYGMGPGLIHAIFEREAESNGRSCPDVAIPIIQYVMPVLNLDNINNMTRVNTYVNTIMNSVMLLGMYLKRTSRFIKRSIRNIAASSDEPIHIDLLENARNLPDFNSVRTIYVSDPDCINIFAPGFRGVYKAGDRGRLENMFADARKKLEDIYYVIAARRPLVPEEYLEDEHHSISMHVDADRQDYDTEAFANLYREVRAYLAIGSDKALANPDVSISSLDARPLQLGSVNSTSDTTNYMDNSRYVIVMDTSDNSTDLSRQRTAFCVKRVPFIPPYISIISSICPSFKSIPIKGRRRGYPYSGLFVEAKSWALADRLNNEFRSWGVSPQLYQVTDRRDSDVRLPIIAIPEFSGAKMCEGITNNVLNSASDISIRDEADHIKLNYSGFTQIPNKVTRITADSNYLPPHTNYRFLEAERRRWNLQKYPKYKSSSYIRNVKLCYEYAGGSTGAPYPSRPWQINGSVASVDLTDYRLFVNGNNRLDESEGNYEKTLESKRRRLLIKASSTAAADNSETKGWEQLWLERLLNQLNTLSNEDDGDAFRPMNYERRQIREIALSLHPEYRKSVSALAIHTIVDTEDISRSINIYAELIDGRDCVLAHIKSRMKTFAALIFNATAPCSDKFLDAVNTDIAKNTVENNTTTAKYSAICKTRELTEIATEIRVKTVKIKMDKELLELRQRKEEYCRKYREAMKSIKKQRRQLLDNRCFLNNKDAFTEEEKGIDSLYRQGQILGYKLILRDRNIFSSSSGDGLSVILDMADPDLDREHLCDRVAHGEISVDLVALTAPIYIWCGAFIFSIGKVTINIRDVFDSVNIKPKFYNEDASLLVKYVKAGMEGDEIPNSISSLNIDAPHVRNHSACLGNLERNLNSASTEDDILAYLDWCLQYLNTVNLGDMYGANLSYFPCVPATMHNIVKYGVLATGRLDERIGIWTGAGTNGERISPYSTSVVQPVWNIGNDLAMALWEDAKRKLEDGMFEGSDISEDDLLNIALEISGQSDTLASIGWKDSHGLFRDILSYSLCKLTQNGEPNVTLSSGARCVNDPSRFASNIRVGLRQELHHRDFFTKRSIEFMNYIQRQNMRFSDIWKPGMNEDNQIHLKDVKNNRLNNYHINI